MLHDYITMKKYHWTTHKIVQQTQDALTIYFNTGERSIEYFPGQYLNIRCLIDGEVIVRSYSFSSIPTDKYPSITVKRVVGGKMSNYLLDHAAKMEEWEIDAPFGTFYLDAEPENQTPIVLLAGGSGISPLYSMLKTTVDAAMVPLLIYANKSPEDTIFWNELEALQTEGQLNSFYSFSASGFNSTNNQHLRGRFSTEVLRDIIEQQLFQLEGAHYYICGPVGLIDLYLTVLRSLKIPETYLHTEFFAPMPTAKPTPENDGTIKDVLVNYLEDTYFNDERHTYACTSLIEVQPGQSLLDAMHLHHIKAPSSCKNGTCGVCWAMKTKGKIQMINNQTLNETDLAEGIILLCQSYPLDQEVTISLG